MNIAFLPSMDWRIFYCNLLSAGIMTISIPFISTVKTMVSTMKGGLSFYDDP